MTADDYAKVIEAALAMGPTPGPWRATRGIDELCDPGTTVWHRESWGVYTDADCHGHAAADAAFLAACHPEAMRALLDELKAKQAKIDALMLEFCPGEMTAEQVKRWASHQKAAATQPETGQE